MTGDSTWENDLLIFGDDLTRSEGELDLTGEEPVMSMAEASRPKPGLVTSEDYLQKVPVGQDGLSYLNLSTKRKAYSFGPYSDEEDPYEVYYRLLATEGKAVLTDCDGAEVSLSIDDVEGVSIGGRMG